MKTSKNNLVLKKICCHKEALIDFEFPVSFSIFSRKKACHEYPVSFSVFSRKKAWLQTLYNSDIKKKKKKKKI